MNFTLQVDHKFGLCSLFFELCSLLLELLKLKVPSTKSKVQRTKTKDQRTFYSNAIRSAAAVAQGAKTNESTSNAPKRDRFPCIPDPTILASTAPAPNIKTGM
jgi:hypothetical protein